MESLHDIRFVQRLDNYRKALGKIKDVVLFRTAGELSELETEDYAGYLPFVCTVINGT